jgi:hypothetical protein
MSVRFKSTFDEERVCPWLNDLIVEPGGVITVPDDQWENWTAGGWEPLDPNPEAKQDSRPSATPAATSTPTPAVPSPAPATPPATPGSASTTTSTKGADQ